MAQIDKSKLENIVKGLGLNPEKELDVLEKILFLTTTMGFNTVSVPEGTILCQFEELITLVSKLDSEAIPDVLEMATYSFKDNQYFPRALDLISKGVPVDVAIFNSRKEEYQRTLQLIKETENEEEQDYKMILYPLDGKSGIHNTSCRYVVVETAKGFGIRVGAVSNRNDGTQGTVEFILRTKPSVLKYLEEAIRNHSLVEGKIGTVECKPYEGPDIKTLRADYHMHKGYMYPIELVTIETKKPAQTAAE